MNGHKKNFAQGENTILLSNPYLLKVPDGAKVHYDIIESENGISIILTTDKTVLYVVLTTRAQGHFEDNAFSIRKGETKVSLLRSRWNMTNANAHIFCRQLV